MCHLLRKYSSRKALSNRFRPLFLPTVIDILKLSAFFFFEKPFKNIKIIIFHHIGMIAKRHHFKR